MRARKPVLVALILVLLALTVPAVSDAKRVWSQVKFTPQGVIDADGRVTYEFRGELFAGGGLLNFTCIKHRRVRVFRDEPTGDDTLIGADKTDFIGFYNVKMKVDDLDEVPGDYYARVKQHKRQGRAHTLRCVGDRSRTVSVRVP